MFSSSCMSCHLKKNQINHAISAYQVNSFFDVSIFVNKSFTVDVAWCLWIWHASMFVNQIWNKCLWESDIQTCLWIRYTSIFVNQIYKHVCESDIQACLWVRCKACSYAWMLSLTDVVLFFPFLVSTSMLTAVFISNAEWRWPKRPTHPCPWDYRTCTTLSITTRMYEGVT